MTARNGRRTGHVSSAWQKPTFMTRKSIEGIYPPDAFAGDASENDRTRIEMLKGVRIASAPDEAGDFEMEPAVHHAGEVPGEARLKGARQ